MFEATTLLIENSTLVGNTAAGSGGAIAAANDGPTVTIVSSVVSGNSGGAAPDISVSIPVSIGTSAIGSKAGFPLTDKGGNLLNLPFADLKLGTLADNGGPTPTILPAFDSPLIDKGSNPSAAANDQRGPGYARSSGGGVDIGAFELQSFLVTNKNNDGAGSLKSAVDAANALTGPDVIRFDPAFFTGAKTINVSATLTISDAVTVAGPGGGVVTLDGTGNNRILLIDLTTPGGAVILTGLTLTNGNSTAKGGAVSNVNGDLTIRDSVITKNTAQFGGGVATLAAGRTTVVTTTVSGNTATAGGGGLVQVDGSQLLLLNSTVSGNTAPVGGGISFSGTPGASGWVIRNSTVSTNTATGVNGGGGVSWEASAGTLTVQNSTFALNAATTGKGGGLHRVGGSGTISLESTIAAGNTTTVAGPDVFTGGTVLATTSLLGSLAGITTFTGDAVSNNLAGKAALLGPLQDNGGPTLTHALLAGSPAINSGSNPTLLTSDQRGGNRRSSGVGPDIGAFEAQLPTVSGIVINGGAAQRSRVTAIEVQFNGVVTLPGSPETAFQLKRQSDGAVVALTAKVTTTTRATAVTLTFTGAVSESLSLADGRYTLTVLASQVSSPAGQLDGNNDNIAGDDFALVGDKTNKLFRLFGDADGNGTVNFNDFLAFRSAFGTTGPNPPYNSAFDFNNDNQVNFNDFLAFRSRFGTSI